MPWCTGSVILWFSNLRIETAVLNKAKSVTLTFIPRIKSEMMTEEDTSGLIHNNAMGLGKKKKKLFPGIYTYLPLPVQLSNLAYSFLHPVISSLLVLFFILLKKRVFPQSTKRSQRYNSWGFSTLQTLIVSNQCANVKVCFYEYRIVWYH